MNRYWTRHYPAGVPTDIDPDQYSSVAALFEESFQRYRNNKAYVCMDKALTYGDLDVLSQALGAWLQAQGLQRGDRVAIMMPNLLQYPIAVAAILRAGFIVVNVNPLYTARELEHQLKDSGSVAIIILENFASTLQKVIANTPIKHVVLASMGDLLGFPKGVIVNHVVRRVKKMVPAFSLPGATHFNKALSAGRRLVLKKPDIKGTDVAVLQYTGGTTGISKGAMLLHRTLVANMLSSEAWSQPARRKHSFEGPGVVLCALPLYHVFAFVTCAMLAMRTGDMLVLIPNPRDIDGLIKEWSKYTVNVFPAVNTLFNALAHHPAFAQLDFGKLLLCNGGGTAVVESTAKRWLEVTGCPIVEGYGLSETSSGITCNPTDSDAYSGSVGMPMPGVEVRIVDDAGNDVAQGQSGEIAIKGPQVMAGYWQRPDETANVTTADGFFRSGDIGVMDDKGYIRIVDRKKDMILVSGFNVYPNEIEAVISTHPGVLECAVVGVPDEHSGEVPMVFVVKKDAALDETALAAFCSEQLTGYKRPKHIRFRTELPKTNVGKILRRDLRDEAKASLTR